MSITTSTAKTAPPPAADAGVAWTGSGRANQILVLTARSLRALVLEPRVLLTSMLTPLLMLVVFSQIFVSVAATPGFPAGVAYIDYLLPAIMVNTAMQSALQTGIALTHEMRDGIITRLRSLPVWPGSILIGRSLAELVRGAIRLTFLLAFALLLFGFRPSGGPVGVLTAMALALVVGGGLGWVFIALACWMRHIELVQNLSGMVTLVLMFGSNAFVPIGSLPGWLQVIATLNPMSYGIAAARDLTLGHPATGGAALALGASLTVATLAAAIAVRGFQRPA
ncbi:ABC transporter permease [Actinomadura macra]|uniref:ABC transporter permease n=1 Tax=Actinomadura macra TaxID=46164 RepID=UPI000B065F0C|nr:ABC transporter permease [Actinomadura macra]